jgi:hypothetical protein
MTARFLVRATERTNFIPGAGWAKYGWTARGEDKMQPEVLKDHELRMNFTLLKSH